MSDPRAPESSQAGELPDPSHRVSAEQPSNAAPEATPSPQPEATSVPTTPLAEHTSEPTAALSTPEEPYTGRGQRRLLLTIAGGLGLFILLGCLGIGSLFFFNPELRNRISGNNAPPEGPDKYADTGFGAVNINDTFESPTSRWDRSQTQIIDGTYELGLELDNFDSYGLFLGPGGIRDFDLAVDATQTAGDPISEYGIRFRQSAPDEHLQFSISGNGFFRLVRVSDESYSSLVPWTYDSRIQQGLGTTNRLRVVADGPAITAYVNGAEVLRYTDNQQEVGQLTLGLITFDQGGLVVRFDNIEGDVFAAALNEGDAPASISLNEDFSDPASAPWSVGGATIRDGAYEAFVGGPVQSWQQPLPTGSSEVDGDFILEVDATLMSGNEGGSGYGIMFADNGSFEFLALYLLPEGGLMLIYSGPDGGTLIPPTNLPSIKPGLNETNHIKLEAEGNMLTLTINDEELEPLEFPDGISFAGRAGIIMMSSDLDGVRARFDNFHLEEIQ